MKVECVKMKNCGSSEDELKDRDSEEGTEWQERHGGGTALHFELQELT